MEEQWTLHETREWMLDQCVEQYRANPSDPVLHIPFHQAPSPDTPPDGLILRSFHLLEEEGVVTGYVIDSDNAGAIWIRDLQLSSRAILQLQTSADREAGAGRQSIGFTSKEEEAAS